MEYAKFEYKGMKDPNKPIKVMFNPDSYTIKKNVKLKEDTKPDEAAGSANFLKIGARELSMDLYFDTLNEEHSSSLNPASIIMNIANMKSTKSKAAKNVREYTELFNQLTQIKSDTKKPPVVRFSWGSFSFIGYISSLTEKYTMFNSLGVPVKATLSISISESFEKFNASAKKDGGSASQSPLETSKLKNYVNGLPFK